MRKKTKVVRFLPWEKKVIPLPLMSVPAYKRQFDFLCFFYSRASRLLMTLACAIPFIPCLVTETIGHWALLD